MATTKVPVKREMPLTPMNMLRNPWSLFDEMRNDMAQMWNQPWLDRPTKFQAEADRVHANFKEGVLEVKIPIPKEADVQPKKIAVH